jgi:hypothetical protein
MKVGKEAHIMVTTLIRRVKRDRNLRLVNLGRHPGREH